MQTGYGRLLLSVCGYITGFNWLFMCIILDVLILKLKLMLRDEIFDVFVKVFHVETYSNSILRPTWRLRTAEISGEIRRSLNHDQNFFLLRFWHLLQE